MAALCRMRPQAAPQFVLAYLTDALDHPTDWRLVSTALTIAVHNGHILPIELCLRMFGRKWDTHIRMKVAELVRYHGETGIAVLEDVVRTGSPDERVTAAMALARDGGEEAFDVLVSELTAGLPTKKWRREVVNAVARHYGERLMA